MSILQLIIKSFKTESTTHISRDWALLISRLFFGLSIAFAHGFKKLPPSDKFINFIGSLGFPFPEIFAWQAGIAEGIGGLLIAIGLATRLSAFTLFLTMIVAVFMAHSGDPYKKMELGLCYLSAAILFMSFGGGRLSLDHFFFKASKNSANQ